MKKMKAVVLFVFVSVGLAGLTEAVTNATAEDIEEILRHHNFLRRTAPPLAANMLPLVWNEELADQAHEWALNCSIEHGFPPRPNSTFGTHVGQNIWLSSLAQINLTVVIQSWYDEIDFYNWEETKCHPPPGGMCTHYTQLMWASTTDVGCSYYHCPWNGHAVVVCNYGPQGNLANTRPYLAGPPCSQCPNQEGWCDEGFCVDCPAQNCDCALECKNCGVLDPTTCTCTCKDGWDSPDCSVPCENGHRLCGANPGWPSAAFCTMTGFDVVNDYCREMCGHCDFATPGDPNACCEGQMCYNGGYLDESTCLCVCPAGFEGADCNGLDGGDYRTRTRPTEPPTGTPAPPLECFVCSSENVTEGDPCHLEQEPQAYTETCESGERCIVRQTVDSEGRVLAVERSCDMLSDCGIEDAPFAFEAAELTEWRYCCDHDKCNGQQLRIGSGGTPTAPLVSLLFCLVLTTFSLWE
ncbi:PREDICTED: multiple epidermal growth factor-like domains protein 6 [Branchiostoma belcheri]|uniref:Multiple epidermal growth factor-like domains protein 6 n=1 Tax=Branchiostoma belcheri TaxID=7741 RepID=A0A6P4Y3S6_BRABE|nr:PREDICTED: multiple epidermal growth factor-like domains protein 6 [Branchiostoma belcheri]